VQRERPDGIELLNEAGGGVFLYPSQLAGTNQATYVLFEVDDIDKAVAELRERGVTFEEYDIPADPASGFEEIRTVNGIAEIQGIRSVWFKDPDGNILSVDDYTG
jgi:catechol 2,3-dioxygenase-like lactoylglutathione lyase family enzyme